MKHKRKTNIIRITGLGIILIIIGVICFLGARAIIRITREKPEDLIVKYMAHIEKKEYDAMYSMIDPKSSYIDGKEAYMERNSKIYEGLYEKELKGKDGCEIRIVDCDGNMKTMVANVSKEDGKDIQLTIDSDLQKSLYEQFKDDRGCSVAMNPYTGEVLALVSTPSYDNNDFIKGMSSEKWTALNEDENKPLYNRFRQVWCPGSTFKPVVAAIGLKTGTIDPNEDFGNEGLAWQNIMVS